MTSTDQNKFTFPVGYHKFHKDQVFNFQLNRWHSLGYTRFEDMAKVGQRVTNFHDWKKEMVSLAEEAVSEKRYMNAAFYYRAAEFYILEENDEKQKMYDLFSKYFYKAFKDKGIERFEVPYEKGALPAIKLKASGMQAWQSFQTMYITKKEMPIEGFEEMVFNLNENNLHSELVKQDVLILTGRNDHFIPFKAHKMQVRALTIAKSVTAKVFTKETHANNHCQIGNTGLMLDSIMKWIEGIS